MNTLMGSSFRRVIGAIALLLLTSGAQAFNQFWDSSTDAGYQHGNGVWSTTDAQWTLTGTSPVAAWTNFNRAVFAAEGGSSAITLNSPVITTGIVFHGSAHVLTISNGGSVSNSGYQVGMIGGTNRIELIGGASTASWTNNTTLNIGLTNGFNEFIVNGAGTAGSAFATNTGVITLGNRPGSTYNRLTVTNGGWLNSGGAAGIITVVIGNYTSSYNSAEVMGGGSRWNLGGLNMVIGTNTAGPDNVLRIDGQGVAGGAIVTNVGILNIGALSSSNSLIVTNGGRLFTGGATYNHIGGGPAINCNAFIMGGGSGGAPAKWDATYIAVGGNGPGASFNSMLIDGAGVNGGALVTNSGNLVVGLGNSGMGTGNVATIRNGGQLVVSGTSYIGYGGTSNSISVLGGSATSLWQTTGNILIGSLVASRCEVLVDGKGVDFSAIATNAGSLGLMIGSGPGNSYCGVNVVDKGRLYVSGGIITNGNTTGTNNYILVNNGYVWAAQGIRLCGIGSSVTVTNGGQMVCGGPVAYSFLLGQFGGASNNVNLIGGAGVTSVWDNSAMPLYIGFNTASTGNMVIIDGKDSAGSALATNVRPFVGYDSRSPNSVLIVTNGGWLFSTGTCYIGYSVGSKSNQVVVTGSGSRWDLGRLGSLLIGGNDGFATNNTLTIDQGALVTNGAFTIGAGTNRENALVITNASSLFSVGVCSIGVGPASTGNCAIVTGIGSIWDLAGSNLAIGATANSTNNFLMINQTGTVDDVGTLTVRVNNQVYLNGGTLGLSNAAVSSGRLFTIGDGMQTAALKMLGGTAAFGSGLLVNSNATLKGIGSVNGAAAGVVITNGATFDPGINGAGTLTVSGSNFTWYSAAPYHCDLTSMAPGGWDILNVSTQLVLLTNGGPANFTILLDTTLGPGGQADNFDMNQNYDRRILTWKSAADFDLAKFTLNTNNFGNAMGGGAWSLMTNATYPTNLYISYRPAGAVPTVKVWNVPGNGGWSVDGNWVDGTAPFANDSSNIVQFGGAGIAYFASNNLSNAAGFFQLNELVLTNTSIAATNVIAGAPLQFCNAGAGLEQWGAGSFTISNSVNLATNLEFRGTNTGMVSLSGNITGAGSLSKSGPWTLRLTASNNFVGPVAVSNGLLRMENTYALSSNSITVSDSMVLVTNVATFTYGPGNNATAVVTGASALWNMSGANLSIGTASMTGNAFVIDQGASVVNAGTLTVQPGNDLRLLGGTLTASTVTSLKSTALTVGDGTQAAVLGMSGGTLLSLNGVIVSSNALLTGRSAVNGGAIGVVLTNGASIAPGISGAGALAIVGSNLTWHGNATYQCDITNMYLGPGVGWDVINVSSQVTLVPGATTCKILLDSRGQVAAGSQDGYDFNLLIMTLGNPGGFDVTKVTLLTNNFVNAENGSWGITNVGTNVYVTFRSTAPATALYSWDAPSNGFWMAGMNWTNRTAPLPFIPLTTLEFGGAPAGAAYYASNNNAGSFALNRLSLTNRNGATTSVLAGNQIEFWNADARLEQGGAGNFIISNSVSLQNDLTISGNGSGTLTLAGAISGFGAITKQSTATLILKANNSFTGLFTEDSPGGLVRVDHTNALGGNSFVINSGVLSLQTNFTMGFGAVRSARVSGSSSIWSNLLAVSLGSNGAVTIANGGKLSCGPLTANGWAAGTTLAITNGGQVFSQGAIAIGNISSNNTALVIGTNSLWNLAGSNVTVGATGFTNNVLTIDQGAVITNAGTLTINPSNDLVFLGGMLSVSNVTSTKGTLLSLGDGSQAATMNIWGGTVSNNAGTLIQSNSIIRGNGLITGGNGGVVFTNGSGLTPGMPGNATNTISTITLGGNATWYGGMTLNLNITNITGSGGVNWDTVRILGNLDLIPNGGKLKIKLDSLGETGGGFDANTARAISLVNFASASASTNDIEVDDTDFLIGSNWFLEVTSSDIRYVYRRATPWVYVATNGNNSAGTNWTTAFTTLTNALNYVQDYDTVYVAGHTFSQTTIVWAIRCGVTIDGGYEANASAPTLPGANDPAIWKTILRPAANGYRVLYATGITNGVLKNVTVCDANNTTVLAYGMGLYVNLCRGLTLDSCIISNNLVNVAGAPIGGGLYITSSQVVLTNCVVTRNSSLSPGGGNGTAYCGGLYLNSGSMTMVRCRVTGNSAANGGAGGTSPTWAGGLYLGAGSSSFISQSVIDRNSVSGAGKFAGGAGIYNLGTLVLANSILDHNNSSDDSGDGIYSSGNLTLINCTVADNYGVGIQFVGGTVGVTNTIVWGHNDDLKGFPNDGQIPATLSNVFYTCTSDDDNNGRQNCFSSDPIFANTNFYHLQSIQGVYTNGYFNGGGWGTSLSNSPLIDVGDPSFDYTSEPIPNGGQINLGAYGNTTVASLTDTTSVFTVATVTNLGARLVGHRTVQFTAQVTATGGQSPSCGFGYWIGTGPTSTVSAGIQTGFFTVDAGELIPGNSYQFAAFASNSAGIAWSDTKAFDTWPASSSLYVSTNGDNTSGASWSTAFTNLQRALDILEPGDTLHVAGHKFYNTPGYQQSSLWSWTAVSDVTVIGGYQATSDVELPGTNNPSLWPTVFARSGGSARILYASGITNVTLKNISLFNGYSAGTTDSIPLYSGIGLYATKCSGLIFDSCNIVSNNAVQPGTWIGAGVYSDTSILTFTNCSISSNTLYVYNNSTVAGGGIYLSSGTATFSRCLIIGNGASGNYGGSGGGLTVGSSAKAILQYCVISRNAAIQGAANGGGILNSGQLILENCLVDHNNSSSDTGDGVYAAAGSTRIVNCTVVDNSGVGIQYVGGTIGMTNSIVWGHSDDIMSFPNDQQPTPTVSNVVHSCILNGDNNGVQGCINLDPLFVDANYYHVQSTVGNYTNGYFSGGGWGTNLLDSPTIDKGDPTSDYSNEPEPKGTNVNMGYDGNTVVAAKSKTSSAVLATVTNAGATFVGHRTATLNGVVTDTGGDIPTCRFDYWIVGSGITSSVPAGLASGAFSSDAVGLTPGSIYQFAAVAVNFAGSVTSDIKTFTTHPVPGSLYVATNGLNSAGTNWSTAFTDPQTAFNIAESGDTIYLAGHSFKAAQGFQQSTLWTWKSNANVSVIGGYAAANDSSLPGANDPAQWPTELMRTSGYTRIMYALALSNSIMRGVTIKGGYFSYDTAANGAGLYMSRCLGLTIDNCVFTNNQTTIAVAGGIYSVASVFSMTNCVIVYNIAAGAGNGHGDVGGLYLASGVMTMNMCRVANNWASGSGFDSAMSDGGGILLGAASTSTITRTVISGNSCTTNGGGIYNSGTLLLANCVIDHNNSAGNTSDGMYLAGGSASIVNCTVANNSGTGIRRASGTVTISNSILWNNGDDLTGSVAVAYSDIQTADSFWTNGINGCISTDPVFVNTTYYHEQSKGGNYTNGYFSGGGWELAASNSLCIDAGDPASFYNDEPAPRGRTINMGAYGNTDVASKTYIPPGSILIFY